MRCVAYLAGLSACLALSLPGGARAQSSDYSTLTSPQSAQNWYLTLGGGLRYQPDYAGSDDYVFRARPIISLSKGLKSTWWSAEDDAMLSIGFFSGQGWRIGFSGDLLWKRDAKVNHALVAVPATKFGAEAGGFVEFYPTSWLRARADLRNEKISYKVREHSLAKVPVILAVGRREAEEKTVTVRRLGSQAQTVMSLAEALAALTQEATAPDLARIKAVKAA